MTRTVRILGTHGVPATYGGFETAAERIGLHLVSQGWRVIVYCQAEGRGPTVEDTWHGIERVVIPQHRTGWRGTAAFDLDSIRHASRHRDVCLTFGYNTGVFNSVQWMRGVPNIINMDGMEWTRSRWGLTKQGILLANERLASLFGTHLIADHPEIAAYLRRWARDRKVSVVTYGADAVNNADVEPLAPLGLTPQEYLTVICRPIPENSLLEIVTAFTRRLRGKKLVVLGDFRPNADSYHRRVIDASNDEVLFPGAIYDPETVRSLRFHSLMYVHGHTVGGTNPSLVEALGAGNPVIAHDNKYNRWVAGPRQRYFSTPTELASALDECLADPASLAVMRAAARARHAEEFTWDHVGRQYEELLLEHTRGDRPSPSTGRPAVGVPPVEGQGTQ